MKNPDSRKRLQPITEDTLKQENLQYFDTGGISANNRGQGFTPAFLDTETGNVYQSLFRDGSPAPVHVMAGLPSTLFDPGTSLDGRIAVKQSVISGFLRKEKFYSREEAAQANSGFALTA